MATYKSLYWQEVPSQIKVDDGSGRNHSAHAAARRMERIDLLAAKRKLQDADDYLARWKWGEEEERDGSAGEVAAALIAELESQADW